MSSRKDQKSSARVVREQLARERRRRRTLWTSAAAVAVLVIAGLIGYAVWSGQRPAGNSATPPGTVAGGTAVALGSGPVTIDIYEDFQCPVCRQFEQQSGDTIDQLVAQNKVKVQYHPIAILDRFSTTNYSTRSAAAAGCTTQTGKFRDYAKALFAQQPAEGSAGLTNDQLVDIGNQAGISGGDFAACVKDQRYKGWTQTSTDTATKNGVNGTPTVLVNGQKVDTPTPENITAAVTAAAK
ncbi:DsbA family protein [Plantactinospora siamensis]|uniref:DsbA family protein n=1 Tax=Plantactinospora siamensis TaxID=555372 RepID=A0ABV6NTN0_9ACTN